MVQTLFPDRNAIFQDDNAPIHIADPVQDWFPEHADEVARAVSRPEYQ